MAKLISQIQNYPLSNGAVAMNNPLLLENSYVIQDNELKDYFNFLLEISKDINFFDDLDINSKSWFDLLKQGSIFRFAQFLTISTDELSQFFSELEQTNHFNSDSFLSQKEYETLCYQRFQIIQYLFSFYKSVSETITDNNETSILSILKSNTSTQLYVQFDQLSKEYFTLFKSSINKIDVEDFNEIQFESVNLESISILKSFFNPTKISTTSILNIYSQKYEKIKAANKYLFSIFKGLMQIHQTFSNWAITRLNELVTSKNDHSPHNALLITFCKLKMLFDQRYNQLITQDTSFVFEDILQLKREEAVPDTALISINLAKNKTEYFLEKDSLFKAGKNSENKTVFYKSNQNLVLNNAKIEKIKSTVRVFKDNQISNIFKVDDAANAAWQVNNAWLPFNDLAEAWTGIGFESKLISEISKKDTEIYFEFTFKNAIPITNAIKDKFEIKILLENDIEEVLIIKDVIIDGKILKFWAVVAKDLTKTVKMGINARICLISPSKENINDDFVNLYKYLLSEQVRKVEVKLKTQHFAPGSVKTTTATGSGSESFIAFGSQSLAGSSFSITHPFLNFANKVDLSIEWAANIKNSFPVFINEEREETIAEGDTNSPFIGISNNNNDLISFKLKNDVKTEERPSLPIVLQVKSIMITADLSEVIYEKDQNFLIKFIDYQYPNFFILKSINLPFIQKLKQKLKLRERFIEYHNNTKREHYNNFIEHLYPLGSLEIYPTTQITFLPDYNKNEFHHYVGELCLGLNNIRPGQSISLLFNIAEETAEQSKLEAKISWYYLKDNKYIKIEASKLIDSTLNFLQSGLVQLSLPEDATNNNTILEGDNIYWLIARCDNNYEIVANIKEIKTNGLAVTRLLDSNNQETKVSVAPATIENIYPKTANIKEINQSIPSRDGRAKEVDSHFYWRSSQRLRHKQRAINQWDFEQIILSEFNEVYKVKCHNHAYYLDTEMKIYARSRHTLLVLLPHYRLNIESINFQPALPMSKLVEIKKLLETKTGPFNQLQVLNTNWDVIKIEVSIMLNKGYIDLPFYKNKLEEDLKKLIAPWAFEQEAKIIELPKLYLANIVDYIDELEYIHHIKNLKIYKNDIEQFDEIIPTSEIHLLTSAFEHTVNVIEYA